MNIRGITFLKYAAALAIIVIAIAVYAFQNGDDDIATNDLERLSNITLQNYAGISLSFADLDFRGRPLVINSWAVWCPFCKQELPDFAALQGEFPDIVVIAIDRAEPVDTVRAYTDGLGITNKMTFLLDPGDGFYKSIGGFSMPETIFVDEGGRIVFQKRGPMTLEEMREAVNKHLQ